MIFLLQLDCNRAESVPQIIPDITPSTVQINASVQWVWQLRQYVATCPVCGERTIGNYTEAHNHINNHEWACGPSTRFQFAPFALIPGGEA